MRQAGITLFWFLMLNWQVSSATTVRLVTIGPGDAFWSAFGHTAIALDETVYGFGYFSFDDDIVSSFINNQMMYDLGVSDLNHEVRLAQQQNRDFSVVELNLTAQEVLQLEDYLRWHIQPENQTYSYDYFLNNCSTKVRDLLALVWGRSLHDDVQINIDNQYSDTFIGSTFPAKHQSLMNFGLALGYGWPAYTSRSAWELMAFPLHLEQYILTNFESKTSPRQLIYQADDIDQISGLVKTHWFLMLYTLLWTMFLWLKRTRQFAVTTWFYWHALVGLVLLALWLFTPHPVADWNFNVLLMMPLGLLIYKHQLIRALILVAWLVWLCIAIYCKAGYLMPLMVPGMMALLYINQNHSRLNKNSLTFGGVH